MKCRNAWTAIAAKAYLEDEDVKKKWKNLRDKFTKVQKKLSILAPWAGSLSFLREAPESRQTASNLDENEEEDVGQEDQDLSNAADDLALSDTLEQLHDKHDRSDISKTGKFTEPKEFKCRKRSYQPDMIDEALLKYLKEKSGDKDEEDLLFGKNDPY
uniref:MADF domain-containing protein n=1 Tax=Romanomermis culicivorax TaxID=13658 RepID=A0A915JMF0_ROMCU